MLLRWGCTWLTLMPLLLSLSTGELSFYRDALPETSEDIALKQLARYLEAHRLQQRLDRSYLATFGHLSPVHKKHSDLQHQEERRIVEFIVDRKAAQDKLNQKLSTWLNRYSHHPPHYHRQIANRDSEYFNLGHKYADYPEEKQLDEMDNNDDRFSKDPEYGRTYDADRGGAMREEEPVVDPFRDKTEYIDHNYATGVVLHHEGGMGSTAAETTGPEFTYKFDDSNLEEKHPFAVRPNDPRYYNDAPFSSAHEILQKIHNLLRGIPIQSTSFLQS